MHFSRSGHVTHSMMHSPDPGWIRSYIGQSQEPQLAHNQKGLESWARLAGILQKPTVVAWAYPWLRPSQKLTDGLNPKPT